MEDEVGLDNLVICTSSKDAQGKAKTYRYGDIKWFTNTDRERIESYIAWLRVWAKENGIKFSQQFLADFPSWESSPVNPYLPYNPYIFGYLSDYEPETQGRFWKSVFNVIGTSSIARPISGWPYTGMNIVGLATGQTVSISNRFRPPCFVKKIIFSALLWLVPNTIANTTANVSNVRNSFFIVPQDAVVNNKWELLKIKCTVGRSNAGLKELIAEWCTLEEMFAICPQTEVRNYSPSTINNSFPMTFTAVVGNFNNSFLRAVNFIWTFDREMRLDTGDSLQINVGRGLSIVIGDGTANVRVLTAIAYFEKQPTLVNTYNTNSINSTILVS